MPGFLFICTDPTVVKFSCFCIYLWCSLSSIILLAVDCSGAHYVLHPYFLLMVSSLGSVSFLSISILFICLSLCVLVNLSMFGQLVVCLLLFAFQYLIPEAIICWFGDDCYVSLGTGYDVSSLCHSVLVTSPIVVFWSILIIVPSVCGPCLCIVLLQLILLVKDNYISIFFVWFGLPNLKPAWCLSFLSHIMGSLLNLDK